MTPEGRAYFNLKEDGVTGFTLAHFSDPHLGPLPRCDWRLLANKRITGFLSWTRNRVKIHRPNVLEMLLHDLKAQKPQHIAVTGDLVNISLPDEFRAAATWLHSVGTPDEVTIIPGNHDSYVDMPWSDSLGLWSDYMKGRRVQDTAERTPTSFADFPFVRRIGNIALIGTSTAVPMPPFIAAGRLGEGQLARLREMLRLLRKEGLFRIVMIHHPPSGGGAYKRKSLLDAREFQKVLADTGAELVLHGHTHISSLSYLAGPKMKIPVVGVPSASAVAAGHKDPSRYHIYTIERGDEAWRLEIDVRGLGADQKSFVPEGRMALSIPLLVSDRNRVTGAAA